MGRVMGVSGVENAYSGRAAFAREMQYQAKVGFPRPAPRTV